MKFYNDGKGTGLDVQSLFKQKISCLYGLHIASVINWEELFQITERYEVMLEYMNIKRPKLLKSHLLFIKIFHIY